MSDTTLPRVLHVGNVANNAYLNAKLLRAAGVESDVLQYAHYHVMGCPEWEDADVLGGPVDEARPDWRLVDLQGFARPDWFAHGPFRPAAAYLAARRGGHPLAPWRGRWLDFRRDLICGRRWQHLRHLRQRTRDAGPAPMAAGPASAATLVPAGEHAALVALFQRTFPDRPDQLTGAEVSALLAAHGMSPVGLRRLFSGYDVVHAYGAEPILPLVASHRPYVAFEHGTLRALPFTNSTVGRLTALAYRMADLVLITNADNRAAAERLGIERYRFVPHPVNEIRPAAADAARSRAALRERLDADFVVFHPSRQHWGPERDPHLEKGNDRLIDGLARFIAARPRAAAVFVAWGQSVEASRARLAAHGIAGRVLWIDPVPGPALARYMSASDVVADQFFLGSFGAITPRALFLGTPPLLYLDEPAHQWCFSEPPPVMNAEHPEAIAEILTRAHDDPSAHAALGRQGAAWYERHHSNAVVRAGLVEAYASAIARNAKAA